MSFRLLVPIIVVVVMTILEWWFVWCTVMSDLRRAVKWSVAIIITIVAVALCTIVCIASATSTPV